MWLRFILFVLVFLDSRLLTLVQLLEVRLNCGVWYQERNYQRKTTAIFTECGISQWFQSLITCSYETFRTNRGIWRA